MNNLSFIKDLKLRIFLKKQNLKYTIYQDIDFKELYSNILKNDYQKQTNFFLNSSNYKKNFNKVMMM